MAGKAFTNAIKEIAEALKGIDQATSSSKKNLKDVEKGLDDIGKAKKDIKELTQAIEKNERVTFALKETAKQLSNVINLQNIAIVEGNKKSQVSYDNLSRGVKGSFQTVKVGMQSIVNTSQALESNTNKLTGRINQMKTSFNDMRSNVKGLSDEMKRNVQANNQLHKATNATIGAMKKSVGAMRGSIQDVRKSTQELVKHASSVNAELAKMKKEIADMKKEGGGGRGGRGVFGALAIDLRTLGTILSALGIANGFRAISDAMKDAFQRVKELDKMGFAMSTVVNNGYEFAESQQFITEISNKFGVEIVDVTERYTKFRAAAIQSNLTMQETQKIFSSVTKASGTLGLKSDELRGVYLALEQMLSKGKVTTEELRRQLGERLPGAFGIMADALGVSLPKLDEMLKKGEIMSREALPKFAEALEKAYGIESVDKIDTLQASQVRMINAWTLFVQTLEDGDTPISKQISKFFDFATALITSMHSMDDVQEEYRNMVNWTIRLGVVIRELIVVSTGYVLTMTLMRAKTIASTLATVAKTLALGKAKDAMVLLNTVMRASPWGLLGAGILLAGTWLYRFVTANDEATASMERSKKIKEEGNVQNDAIVKTLMDMTDKSKRLEATNALLERSYDGLDRKLHAFGVHQNDVVKITDILADSNIKTGRALDFRLNSIKSLSREERAQIVVMWEYTEALKSVISETKKQIKAEEDSQNAGKDKSRAFKEKKFDSSLFDFYIAKLNLFMSRQERIFKDEEKTLKDRLEAQEQHFLASQDILRLSVQKEIDELKHKEKEFKRLGGIIASSPNATNIESLKERHNSIREEIANQSIKIETLQLKFNKDIETLYYNHLEEIDKITEDDLNKRILDLKKKSASEMDLVDKDLSEKLRLEHDKNREGLTSRKEYEENVRQIVYDSQQLRLKLLIDNLKEEAKLYKPSDPRASEVLANIAKYEEEKAKTSQEFSKDTFDRKANELQEELEMVQNFASEISSIYKSISDAKIQEIDRMIEAEEEYYDKLIKLADGDKKQKEVLEEEKEAKIKALEERRRKEQVRQARFNKASAIIDIAINTAVAVSKVTAQSGIFGLPLIPVLVALGALQTASVLAQPIPKFKDGGTMKRDGLAVVGDGGRREVVETKKGTYLTDDRPQLVNLEKGTRVYKSVEDYKQKTMRDVQTASVLTSLEANRRGLKGAEVVSSFNRNFDALESKIVSAMSKAKVSNTNNIKVDLNHLYYRKNTL